MQLFEICKGAYPMHLAVNIALAGNTSCLNALENMVGAGEAQASENKV